MNERVFIIVGIIAQYFLSDEDFSDEKQIVEGLLVAGFEEDEIHEAFRWMEKITLHPDQAQQIVQLQPPRMRIFSPQEQQMLAVDAQGFLLHLRLAGIISSEVMEEVIIKACHGNEDQVNRAELKSLTVLTMFANLHNDHAREIDCIIENNLNKLYN